MSSHTALGASQTHRTFLQGAVSRLVRDIELTSEGFVIPNPKHTSVALAVNWFAASEEKMVNRHQDPSKLGFTDGKTVIVPMNRFGDLSEKTLQLMADDVFHAAQMNLEGQDATGLKLDIVSPEQMRQYLEYQVDQDVFPGNVPMLLGYDADRIGRFAVIEAHDALMERSGSVDLGVGEYPMGAKEAIEALNTTVPQDVAMETFNTPGQLAPIYANTYSAKMILHFARAAEHIASNFYSDTPKEFNPRPNAMKYMSWLAQQPNMSKEDTLIAADVVSHTAFNWKINRVRGQFLARSSSDTLMKIEAGREATGPVGELGNVIVEAAESAVKTVKRLKP